MAVYIISYIMEQDSISHCLCVSAFWVILNALGGLQVPCIPGVPTLATQVSKL
jgi:hypothetical protein